MWIHQIPLTALEDLPFSPILSSRFLKSALKHEYLLTVISSTRNASSPGINMILYKASRGFVFPLF